MTFRSPSVDTSAIMDLIDISRFLLSKKPNYTILLRPFCLYICLFASGNKLQEIVIVRFSSSLCSSNQRNGTFLERLFMFF